MARYVKDITLNKPEDFVNFIMNDYIQKNGYQPFKWKKKEPCLRCGDGMVEGFKYIKWSYHNGTFHIEAWMKGSFGKEMDLDGFVAIVQKKPFKASLENLISVLQQPLPDNAYEKGSTVASSQTIQVQSVDQSGSAIGGFVVGLLAIPGSIIPLLGIILGCVSFGLTRMGLCSSKRGLAMAGRVCALIGVVLAIVFWILNIVGVAIGGSLY